jgi:hypothetical protein
VIDLQELRNEVPYWYTLSDGPIKFADAAVASSDTPLVQRGSIRIDDTPFVWCSTLVTTRVDDTGDIMGPDDNDGSHHVGSPSDPGVEIEFFETGKDSNMQNVRFDAFLFNCNGGFRPLPRRKLLRPATTLQVNVALMKQLAGGTGADVRVVLEGFKLYNVDRAQI